MMQKKKTIAEFIFLVCGSIMAIVLSVILISNFLSDGRSSSAQNESEQKQVIATYKPDIEESQPNEFQTLKFQRNVVEEIINKPKPSPTNSIKEKKSEKVSIEVINYTNIPKLAERYKKVLESEGFEAIALNLATSKSHETSIIERNENIDGQSVYEVIKIGKIKKILKKNYPYDMTLVLGDDINP